MSLVAARSRRTRLLLGICIVNYYIVDGVIFVKFIISVCGSYMIL